MSLNIMKINQLRETAFKMSLPTSGVKVLDRKWRLTTYPSCFIGNEAVDWICKELNVTDRNQAVVFGQELLEAGFFKHVVEEQKPFLDDYFFYRFYPIPTEEQIFEHVNDTWLENMIRLLDLTGSDISWELEKQLPCALIFSRLMPEKKIKAYKVSTIIDGTTTQLIDLLHNRMIERHKEWNETFAEGRIVLSVNPTLNIQYWRYALGVLADRDFLVVRRLKRFDDGSVLIADRSIEYGIVPPLKNCVRCNLEFNIRYFKDLANGKCQFVYINLTDIKGWVPSFVVNKANADISYQEIQHIAACIAKDSQIESNNSTTNLK
eukprot:TRINITY_DN2699_c2_g1_i1.p1 TRINITY_DN2699_c2_g1~~TRINITY_DN2699_c2_g1_i1.p1  ORF type:complete len:321 (+),score=130.33 TRINITY_DN2699_c2_g1_i1:197-1159(+)